MSRRPVILVLALLVALVPAGCRKGLEDQLAVARAFQDDGQYQESIEPLREILDQAPDNGEANYRLGVALVRTGRLAPAVWPLRKAFETEEWQDQAGQMLAFTLISTANPDEARAITARLLERDPSNIDYLHLSAQANLGARRVEDALTDVDRILEAKPEDPQALQVRGMALHALERWPEAAETFGKLEQVAAAAGDRATAAKACTSRGGIFAEQGESARAEETLEACLETYSTEPQVVAGVAEFFAKGGKPEKAESVWRRAVEQAPESLPFRLGLGNQLFAAGQRDEAEQVLRKAAEDFASPQAWEALSDLLRRAEDFAAAEEALQKALASGGDSERLRFKRADLLVDVGDLDGAEALTEGFERRAYRDFVRGRVLLLRGDPAGALAVLEEGLVDWPDNAAARSMAGRAAQELGDYDRAFQEYREAIRADVRATDAAYAAAHLAHSLGQYDKALEYDRYQLVTHPYKDPGPYVIGIESALATGQDEFASQIRAVLELQVERGDAPAVAALARLDQERQGPEAAVKTVEESGLDLADPAKEPALRAWVDAKVAQGRAAEALGRVERALAAAPEDAALLDLRGRVLAQLGRSEEARASFEKAVESDASFAPSLAALGSLAVQAGDLPAALGFFDRAVAADPSDAESAYRAAQVTLAQGDRAGAEERLRAVLARAPGHVGACNDLAWILAEDGRDLDRALALAQRAVERAPGSNVDLVDTLAFVQLARGEPKAAVETLEKALEEHPDSGTLRYRLGLAHAQLGESQAALEAFRQALRDASFGQTDEAQAEIARLEATGADR